MYQRIKSINLNNIWALTYTFRFLIKKHIFCRESKNESKSIKKLIITITEWLKSNNKYHINIVNWEYLFNQDMPIDIIYDRIPTQ